MRKYIRKIMKKSSTWKKNSGGNWGFKQSNISGRDQNLSMSFK